MIIFGSCSSGTSTLPGACHSIGSACHRFEACAPAQLRTSLFFATSPSTGGHNHDYARWLLKHVLSLQYILLLTGGGEQLHMEFWFNHSFSRKIRKFARYSLRLTYRTWLFDHQIYIFYNLCPVKYILLSWWERRVPFRVLCSISFNMGVYKVLLYNHAQFNFSYPVLLNTN